MVQFSSSARMLAEITSLVPFFSSVRRFSGINHHHPHHHHHHHHHHHQDHTAAAYSN